jgi:hypothetical protein
VKAISMAILTAHADGDERVPLEDGEFVCPTTTGS